MIVREAPGLWLLISQVHHAQLAADIAAAWRHAPPLVSVRHEFLAAVARHDDGWRDWERAPTVNPGSGGPRDFMEMPMTEATRIWTGSVRAAREVSPWCALWVSRHFCHLAELASRHREDPDDSTAIVEFLAAQAVAQQADRAAAKPTVPRDAATPLEMAGFRGLQFFDRLSLWLCCAERTEPQDFDDPFGGRTRWTPDVPNTVHVRGGGFTASMLSLAVPAVAIPRHSYGADAELHEAIAHGARQQLHWKLIAH